MAHARIRTLGLAATASLAVSMVVATPAVADDSGSTQVTAAQTAVDTYGGCTINVESDDYQGQPAWEVEIRNADRNQDANGRIEVKVSQDGTSALAVEDEDSDDGEQCDPALPSADNNGDGNGDGNDNGSGQPSFSDVDSSMTHYENIMWLAEQKITTPAGDEFMPRIPVTRGSMTAFLYRMTHPGKSQPECTATPFSDVPKGYLFCGDIQWAYDNGIVFGDAHSNTYRPNDPVTRAQMAAYLHRIATDSAPTDACESQPFDDVAVDGTFCGAIAWARDHGITEGVDGGQDYAPDRVVRRAPMASFLHRVDTSMNGA